MGSVFDQLLEKTEEIGYVKKVVGVIAYCDGLPGAKPGEVILFENGQSGKILSLSPEEIEVMTFGRTPIRVGQKVARTGSGVSISVGKELIGKIIDPLGFDLINKTYVATKNSRSIETSPPGIISRKTIKKQLDTGVAIVDLMVPIGYGQRELVVGDRKTGKTNFLFQTIVSAARLGNICIYAAVGKKKIDIKRAEEYFIKNNVMNKVIIVASTSQDPSGIIYLTPYSAITIAEYFRDQGQDTLVILDDLSTHAKFYREISLLANKFPGRNSYPGDIFYTHAKLLERAGNFLVDDKEVSITCIPVVETSQGDFSGYIQTNIISMTDGHIFFDNNLFSEGRRPAVNPFLSVTRVGKQTQLSSKRSINREMLSFMTLFEKMRTFSHFGAEVTDSVRVTLETGNKITAGFDQDLNLIIPSNVQAIFITLLWSGQIKETDAKTLSAYRSKLIQIYQENADYKTFIDGLIFKSQSFNALLMDVQKNIDKVFPKTI